jgi:hypothetical protein
MLNVSNDFKQAVIDGTAETSLEVRVYTEGALGYEAIPSDNIVSESMSLKQSICDESELKLGGAIAATFEIQLVSTTDLGFGTFPPADRVMSLEGKRIDVAIIGRYPGTALYPSSALYPSASRFPGNQWANETVIIFSGTVHSCSKSTFDDIFYNLIAYDDLRKLNKLNVSRKLRQLMVNADSTPERILGMISEVSGVSVATSELPAALSQLVLRNYDWENKKNKESNSTKITALDLLKKLGEIESGFFFFRGSDRTIHFRSTTNAGSERYEVYESLVSDLKNASDYIGLLFPYGGNINPADRSQWDNLTGYYSNGVFFEVGDNFPPITEANAYDMSDNILAWDYSCAADPSENLSKISVINSNYDSEINSIMNYTPMTLTVVGKPWLEVGDTVVVEVPVRDVYGNFLDINGEITDDFDAARKQIYSTTVLTRTLTGIRALTDTIEAKGDITR